MLQFCFGYDFIVVEKELLKYLKFSKDIHMTDYRGNIQVRFQCIDEEKWEN